MNIWPLAARPSGDALPESTALLPDLIDCIGRPDFGRQALECLNRVLPAASWSVYRVLCSDGPRLYSSGSRGVPDNTLACWRAYRQHGLHRNDRTLGAVRQQAARGAAVLTQWSADEIGGRHRELVYRPHGMFERLSIVSPDGDGLLAVNLYNHDSRYRFGVRDTDRLRSLAPALLACVRRQLAWQSEAPVGTPAEDDDAGPADLLRGLCPDLTPRELQVCERVLRGLTHEGIAADLQLSVTTVKTYRNRAFLRLGIHFRSELYALVLRARGVRAASGRSRRLQG
jgi:DNA-binding CsgD family transcriptional regulator